MSDRPGILIIDDSPGSIQMLAGILEADYEVYFATDGARGLEMVREQHIDLVLLDILMPGMDGYQVCRALKSDPVGRDLPVLFVTAMGECEGVEKGFEAGAADYIDKPVNPAIMRARVAIQLELKALRRSLDP
jgi:putative two-component system response regulator